MYSKKALVLSTYLFILALSCNGQVLPVTMVPLQKGPDSLFELPPVDTLYKWALQTSPTVKTQNAEYLKSSDDLKREKKSWLSAVTLGANIQRGTYGNTAVNDLTLGYHYGASVSIPLYQIFTYKNTVNYYQDLKDEAGFRKDELVQSLKIAVVTLYNNINSLKSQIKIKSDAFYSSYTHVQMAEQEFKKGNTTVSELSRVTELYARAASDLETSRNELNIQYAQLEIITGKRLSH